MSEETELQAFQDSLGPVVLSHRGDILIAENDFILLAFAATDDKDSIGTEGWFQGIWVTFISRSDAQRWKNV